MLRPAEAAASWLTLPCLRRSPESEVCLSEPDALWLAESERSAPLLRSVLCEGAGPPSTGPPCMRQCEQTKSTEAFPYAYTQP